MTDMEEKVARAMALWVGYMGVLETMPPGDPGDPRNEEWVEINFRPFLSAAIKAIEAMRDPTDEMIKAGDAKPPIMATLSSDCSDGLGVWQAMIDKALKV